MESDKHWWWDNLPDDEPYQPENPLAPSAGCILGVLIGLVMVMGLMVAIGIVKSFF